MLGNLQKKVPGNVAEAVKEVPEKALELWHNLGDKIERLGNSTAVEHIKDTGETAGRILGVIVDEGKKNFTNEGLAKLVPAAAVLSRVARGTLGVRNGGLIDRGVGALETGLAIAANWKEHKAIALATLVTAFTPRIFRFGIRAIDVAATLRAIKDMNRFIGGVSERKDEFKAPGTAPAVEVSPPEA